MKSIAVSDELHAVIKEIADKERRQINVVIEIAIENYIKSNEDETKEVWWIILLGYKNGLKLKLGGR